MLTEEKLAATRQDAERIAARDGDMLFDAFEIVELLDAIDSARNELTMCTAERNRRIAENAELTSTIARVREATDTIDAMERGAADAKSTYEAQALGEAASRVRDALASGRPCTHHQPAIGSSQSPSERHP